MRLKCLDKDNLKHANVVKAKEMLEGLDVEKVTAASFATRGILMYTQGLINYYEVLLALNIVKIS